MVSRFFIVITIFFSVVSWANTLKSIEITKREIKLYFKRPLESRELKTSILSSNNSKIKYIFDFKNCKLSRTLKRKYKLKGSVYLIRVSQFKKNIVRVVIYSKKRYKVKYQQRDGESIFRIYFPRTKLREIIKNERLNREKSDIKAKKIVNEAKMLKCIQKRAGLNNIYTVVIDPGHGGRKPGAVRNGIKESDITLNISKMVAKQLKDLCFNVILTRDKDKYISLKKRGKIANVNKANAFVSIHVNSIASNKDNSRVYGIETYFITKNRLSKIVRQWRKELKKNGNRGLNKYLLDISFLNEKVEYSKKLALSVQESLIKHLKRKYSHIKRIKLDNKNLAVLRNTTMPSILVEVGFLSNPRERNRLKTRRYQKDVATGITKGIIRYFRSIERGY